MSIKKISRRGYIKYLGATIASTIIVGTLGAYYYYSRLEKPHSHDDPDSKWYYPGCDC